MMTQDQRDGAEAVAEAIERAVAGLVPESAQPGVLQACRAIHGWAKEGCEPDVPDMRRMDFLYAQVVLEAVAGVANIQAAAVEECSRLMGELDRRIKAGEAGRWK
jgi:hypothetical protein